MSTEKSGRLSHTEWWNVTILRTVLIVGIFLQVVFLSSFHFVRKDLTADRIYTLTDSTRRVLEDLDQRLVIEGYFTRGNRLPAGRFREERQKIANLLDEYRKLGRGMVDVVYFAPEDDAAVEERAQRLGIQPVEQTVIERDSLQSRVVHQGLRLLYGGEKQKVLPLVGNAVTLEAELTPKIKELAQDVKPRIGIFARVPEASPMGMQQGQRPPGYDALDELLRGRFEVQRVHLGDSQMVPEDVEVLLVMLPKDLTDWEKYALDQFLMRGRKMAVFLDVALYNADTSGTMWKTDVRHDASGAKHRFLDQLASYGVKVEKKVALEGRSDFWAVMVLWRQHRFVNFIRYPYFVHAKAQDFSRPEWVAQLAPDDPEAQARLAADLGPGIDSSVPFLQGLEYLNLFWPCPVGLTEELPEGVTGKVLLRTSPFGLTEEPPFNPHPFGGGDPQEFYARIVSRAEAEPRRQVPLAVELEGTFTSFFKDKEIPRAKREPASPEGADFGFPGLPDLPPIDGRPMDGAPAGGDGEEGGGRSADRDGNVRFQDPVQEPVQEPVEETAQEQVPVQVEEEPTPEEPVQEDPLIGPRPPAEPQPEEEPEPEPLLRGEAPSRLVVFGDSVWMRDDALRATGQGLSLGGLLAPSIPASRNWGPVVLMNLVDTYALDDDLVALRMRQTRDRTLDFGGPRPGEMPHEHEARVASTKNFLRWLNVLLAPTLLLGLGLVLFVSRSSEKRSFLLSQERREVR